MSIDKKVEQIDEVDEKVVLLPVGKQKEFYERLDFVADDKYWFEQAFGPVWKKFYSDINHHMLEIKERLFEREYAHLLENPDMEGHGTNFS